LIGDDPRIHLTSCDASCAGLTRASIDLRKSVSKRMDCRVKPGNDEGVVRHAWVKPGNDIM
jgi:hypothetical protein